MSRIGFLQSTTIAENLAIYEILRAQYQAQEKPQISSCLLLIAALAEFRFNEETCEIEITNIDDVKDEYTKQGFENFENNIFRLHKLIDAAVKQSGINLKEVNNITIHRPTSKALPQTKREMLVYNPKRSSLMFSRAKYKLVDRLTDLVKHLLINHTISKALEILEIKQSTFEVLPIKPRLAKGFAGYLRDDILVVGEYSFLRDTTARSFSAEQDRRISSRSEAAVADLGDLATGLKKPPFLTEGGNIITCKNKAGEDVMLIAVSDSLFDEGGRFVGADFEISDILPKFHYSNYTEFCAQIKKWGESLGFKTIVIDRNTNRAEWQPDNPKLSNIHGAYHIDTFLAASNGFLFIPEERIITSETREKLVDEFGEENIIHLSKEDRLKLAANFIEFEGTIIFTQPEISQTLITQLNERGFTCVTPTFQLSLSAESGVRCHVQESPTAAKALRPSALGKLVKNSKLLEPC